MVVVGFAAQALLGALTYLLPVVLGGGPAGGRRLAGLLDAGWPVRLAALNCGTLLVVLPLPAPSAALGWAAAGLAGLSFAGLAVLGVMRGVR